MKSENILGMWTEYCGDGFPSIVTAKTGETAGVDTERLAKYLETTPIWVASPGIAPSLMDDDAIAGTTSIRTDGRWAWHDTLGFYVRKHQFVLPEEFLAWVKERDYTPPAEEELDLESLEFPDFGESFQ